MRVWHWIERFRDEVVAAALTIGLQVEVWTAPYADRRPALALAALVMSPPLAVRPRYPLPAFAASWVGALLASGLRRASTSSRCSSR